jgi:hypothetical protein
MINATQNPGVMLCERLGLSIIGAEGHDLKIPCVSCQSSDAARVHSETGVFFCYSCNKALNAFDLCKVVLGGDQKTAINLMREVGLFETYMESGNGNGKTSPGENILEIIATKKGVKPENFVAYGAATEGQTITFPMYGPDGEICSSFRLGLDGGKGLYEKGKPVGLFLPQRIPQPGEQWAIVEGVKDAAALHGLGYLAAGLPNNRMNEKFSVLFDGVDVVIIPDADRAGIDGATITAKPLKRVARSIRIAELPTEIKESKGDDVRDILKTQGPDAIHKAIADAKLYGESTATDKPIFSLISAQELDSEVHVVHFHIRDLLPRGIPTLDGGAIKTCKTLSTIDAAVSVASGTPCFGYFETGKPTNTIYFCGEGGKIVLQDYGRRTAASKGIALSEIDRLWFCDKLPQFADLSHLSELKRIIRDMQAELVFLGVQQN